MMAKDTFTVGRQRTYLVAAALAAALSCGVSSHAGAQTKPLHTLKHGDLVSAIAFSRAGDILASAAGGYTEVKLDLNDGKISNVQENERTVNLWSVRTGKLLRTMKVTADSIDSLLFLHDGSLMASGSSEEAAHLWQWDARSGKLLRSWKRKTTYDNHVVLSPNGAVTISSGFKKEPVVNTPAKPSDTISLVQDGLPSLEVRSAATGRVLRMLKLPEGLKGSSWRLVFFESGKPIVGGTFENSTVLWEVNTGKMLRVLKRGALSLTTVSPNRKTAVSGGGDNVVRLWDLRSGRILHTLKGHQTLKTMTCHGPYYADGIEAVIFSPNSKIVASGGADTTVRLWSATSGKPLRVLKAHPNSWPRGVELLAFSPDGATLASNDSGTINLWHIK